MEPVNFAVFPEDDAGEVTAVDVAESAGGVVVVGEEDGGVGGVGGVLEEEAVDGLEEELGPVAGKGELAAKVGLEIGHEQGGGDAFAGDVADDEAEPMAVEGEEVVVVAADVTGLDAGSGVVEGFEGRQGLREEAGLDLAGDLKLLGGAAIGLDFFGRTATLLLDLAGKVVGADQFKTVAVDVLETGERDPEDGLLGRLVKAHTESQPELIGGVDVLGEEADLGVAADEAVLIGAGSGCDECEDGLAVGRRDRDPSAVVGGVDVGEDTEAKLVDVEVDAAVDVADVDGGFEDAEVRTLGALRAIGAEWFDSGGGGRFEDSRGRGHEGSPLADVVCRLTRQSLQGFVARAQAFVRSMKMRCGGDCRGLD